MNLKRCCLAGGVALALAGCAGSGTVSTTPAQIAQRAAFSMPAVGASQMYERNGEWHVTPLLSVAKPSGIAVSAGGSVYFVQWTGKNAKVLRPNGIVVSLGGGFKQPRGIALYKSTQYVVDALNQNVKHILPNGSIQLIGSGWIFPMAVATSSDGDVYVMDAGAKTVTRITPQGDSKVVVPATLCNNLGGVSVDSSQNVYVSCFDVSQVFRVQPGGKTTAACSGWSDPIVIAVDASGNLYAGNEGDQSLFECTSDGKLRSIKTDSTVSGITGITTLNGNLYVSSGGQGTLYKLTPPK